MKLKFKDYVFYLPLLLIFLLSSCEKDLFEDGIKANGAIVMKPVSLDDSELQLNSNLMRSVKKLKKK